MKNQLMNQTILTKIQKTIYHSKNYIYFKINEKCIPKGRPRATFKNHIIFYTDSKTKNFEKRVKRYFVDSFNDEEFGQRFYALDEVNVLIIINIKNHKNKEINNLIKKPDIDNYAKSILDALNEEAYIDDSQVVSLNVFKVNNDSDFGEVYLY